MSKFDYEEYFKMMERQKRKDDRVIIKAWLFAILFMIVLSIIFSCTGPVNVKAGEITMADEHLGGFMYINDILAGERDLLPGDPYLSIIEKIEAYDLPDVWQVTDEARDILYRITEAEATGGNVEQKKNVVSCVLSRVRAPQWPDTIKGVVFQSQQFTPIWDGRYYKVTITDSTKEAVDWVLKYGETHDCLWFCSDKSYKKKDNNGKYTSWHRTEFGDSIFFDGEHHYFEGEKYG